MLKVLILAENPAFGRSLQIRLRISHHLSAEHIHFLNVGLPPPADRYIGEFQTLYEGILQYISDDWAEGTSPICVITDLQGYGPFEFKNLNPLGANGWAPVLGMLILALPEVHWVFAGCSFPEDADIESGACALTRDADFSSILEWIQEAAICPLFDAMGVRNNVRRVCMGQDMHRIPIRPSEQAAAIDDEREFAFFHCYVAYRFGYCGHVVATSSMMERLFAGGRQFPIKLIFEDLFLNFSDRHVPGLSDLRKRDQRYKGLVSIPNRVIVTTGYERDREGVGGDRNRIYLDELRADGMWNTLVQKPVAGVYRLWEASGIAKHLRKKNYRENVNDFCRLSDPHAKGQSSAGHSTPGRLLEVAKRLLDRAQTELKNPKSACAAIHHAVLATDALELLGGKTATTSLVALAQCHELEALAECQFLGVEGDFDVDLRLADLQREIKTLSIYYNKASQEYSAWNSESTILQRLIQIFRDHNKFNEEQVMLIRERELHRRIWFRRHFGAFGGFLRWLNPAYIIAWYVEFLLRSISFFAIAIASWILVLTLLHAAYTGFNDWPTSISYAIRSFVSIQSPEHDLREVFLLIAGTAGVLHMGVLIAHLYAVVSRR